MTAKGIANNLALFIIIPSVVFQTHVKKNAFQCRKKTLQTTPTNGRHWMIDGLFEQKFDSR